MRTKESEREAENLEREAPEEQLWEANQGRAKGNKQRAEYENLEGRHERSGRGERGNRGSESGAGNCGSHCEAEAGMAERKKQRLSSEMLKRKREAAEVRR